MHCPRRRAVGWPDAERSIAHPYIDIAVDRQGADARRHVYEHVKEWPRDVLIAQMCAGVFGLIGFSGSPGRESEQLSFLSGIAPAYGDDWWLLSQLAFAQLEVGQLEQAETNIEAALDGNSDSAHSKHVKAHLFYEQLRDDEGWIT
ncbi:MAG: hypothetical protein CM15mP115_19690 [Alphaproteobacteria bacterium]|nr:MAG: hypothetical protein CM15mP115_19690 [Alphaproteobacteria bacterium]